jgi:hypothetical protein
LTIARYFNILILFLAGEKCGTDRDFDEIFKNEWQEIDSEYRA